MNTVFTFCLFLLVATALAEGKPKYCVKTADKSKCDDMVLKGLNVTCVTSEDCLADVVKGRADLTYATATDLVANVDHVTIVLAENVGLGKYVGYYGIAVVKNDSNLKLKELKDKKTCHTGAGKNAGWVIPVGYLLRTKTMPKIDDQWKSAAEYFGGSCVPGVKSKTNDTAVTKKLCQLCKTPTVCSDEDGYAGHEGAFKCMADGAGEVAFVKHGTPESVIAENNATKYGVLGDYRLLCKDESKKEVDDFKNCFIDYRPANAIVTKKDNAYVTGHRKIINAVNVTYLVANEMLSNDTKLLDAYNDTTLKYLGGYIKDVQILEPTELNPTHRPTDQPKYCVKTTDKSKCDDMVTKGLNVTCVTSKDCLAAVVNGVADLAYATANDLVANVDGVKIVLAEDVGLGKYVGYYGVAVVKKDSNLKLKELKDKKTCHTGAGKNAGWVIPVGYLLRTKTMPKIDDQWKSAAEYFGGSCVPGVKSKTNDTAVTKKLCQLCKNPTVCSGEDGYAGHEGAFKCMADGAGEVAFVKHGTPESVIAENNANKYGALGDYRLLCKDESKKDVSKYKECYIDYRPANAIVTKKDNVYVGDYRKIINAVTVADLVANEMLTNGTKSLDAYDDTTVNYLGGYIKDVKALVENMRVIEANGSSTLAFSLFFQILVFFIMSFVF